MNQEQSIDLLSDVEGPFWTTQKIDSFQQPADFLQINDFIDPLGFDHKTKIPVSYSIQNNFQIQKSEQPIDSDQKSEESSQQKIQKSKNSHIAKSQPKEKQQRRNQTSKRYRQRKKQHIKKLQEQNRFLEFKVDELTFRLNEVTRELNQIKNITQKQNVPNYHKVKSDCFAQLESMLSNKIQDEREYLQIQNKLTPIMAFDGKQKIDLLNYFMSELMDNVITDRVFYFIDCLISKKGIHRPNQSVQLSQMDIEIFEILDLKDPKKLKVIKAMKWENIELECKKFQQLWKKQYQVYLGILNQGFKIERMMEKTKLQIQQIVNIKNRLKMDLYFEQNKYRSDFRKMRNLWFRELQRENSGKFADKFYDK